MVHVEVRLHALLLSFQPVTPHERFCRPRFLKIWNHDRKPQSWFSTVPWPDKPEPAYGRLGGSGECARNRSDLQFFTSYYAPRLPNWGMLLKIISMTVVDLHAEFPFFA